MISGELLFSDLSDTSLKTLLTYKKDGPSFLTTDNQTAVDIEQDGDGLIRLLSYREAGDAINVVAKEIKKKVTDKRGKSTTVIEEAFTPITKYSKAGFVVDTFNSSGELVGETVVLSTDNNLTYEAEKLFGIDLNGDRVQGRNVQPFDRDAFLTDKDIYFVGTDDNQTLVTDEISKELLFAPSSDISDQTLLTNKNGKSPFISAPYHTAIDVEQSDDGSSIKLLSYREEHELNKTVKEKVIKKVKGRNRSVTLNKDIQETIPAAFFITEFDSSGKLIQETTLLNTDDPLTYETEELFGIDLNKDNVCLLYTSDAADE